MTNGFDFRTLMAEGFEKDLFDAIEKLGFNVAVNGTEFTNPDFVSQLRQSMDQTSLAIRFQPDGVACVGKIPRSFYVEAKAAKHIEKLAWEQYMKLHYNGNLLAVVFEKLDWRWNFIQDIRLVPGEMTVSAFEPEKRFPVIDNWIYPRRAGHWRQLQPNNPQASGTPYREIDAKSLLSFEVFRTEIIGALKAVELAA